MARYSKEGQEKVKENMEEMKEGKLKSGKRQASGRGLRARLVLTAS